MGLIDEMCVTEGVAHRKSYAKYILPQKSIFVKLEVVR